MCGSPTYRCSGLTPSPDGSSIVVILAPRDEAATFLGHFFSQATTCRAAPASESLAALLWRGEISIVRSPPARVTRQNSSRGARMTTLQKGGARHTLVEGANLRVGRPSRSDVPVYFHHVSTPNLPVRPRRSAYVVQTMSCAPERGKCHPSIRGCLGDVGNFRPRLTTGLVRNVSYGGVVRL